MHHLIHVSIDISQIYHLLDHPVVQVKHIVAKGSGGERHHQVALHHIEPYYNTVYQIIWE